MYDLMYNRLSKDHFCCSVQVEGLLNILLNPAVVPALFAAGVTVNPNELGVVPAGVLPNCPVVGGCCGVVVGVFNVSPNLNAENCEGPPLAVEDAETGVTV